jgi:hypothetical protein
MLCVLYIIFNQSINKTFSTLLRTAPEYQAKNLTTSDSETTLKSWYPHQPVAEPYPGCTWEHHAGTSTVLWRQNCVSSEETTTTGETYDVETTGDGRILEEYEDTLGCWVYYNVFEGSVSDCVIQVMEYNLDSNQDPKKILEAHYIASLPTEWQQYCDIEQLGPPGTWKNNFDEKGWSTANAENRPPELTQPCGQFGIDYKHQTDAYTFQFDSRAQRAGSVFYLVIAPGDHLFDPNTIAY